MSRKQFSQEYRTYGEWLHAQPRESRYARRIIRFHERFPDKSLKDLKAMRVRDYDLSETPWNDLSPEEKRERLLSLELLRSMRKGEHFSPKLCELGLTRDTAIRHLGMNLRKDRGYWRITLNDRIEAEMLMYDREKGKIAVLTSRSNDRTRIARYHAYVRIAMEDNKPELLRRFEYMVVTDPAGNRHQFVTDMDQLFEIKEAEEEPEFFEVYQS